MDESVKLRRTRRGNRSSGGILEVRLTASPCCAMDMDIAFSPDLPLDAGHVGICEHSKGNGRIGGMRVGWWREAHDA